jgi:hypothetical protein
MRAACMVVVGLATLLGGAAARADDDASPSSASAPAAASAPASAPAFVAAPADEPGLGPWDRSIAHERAGRLETARAVLEEAYGVAPGSYEVAVRLAWLTLRQRRVVEAISRYRAARALEGAGAEATQGLAAALTLHGYALLGRGERAAARAALTEAVALDPRAADARAGVRLAVPPPAWAPEAWLGGLYAVLGSVRTFGGTASLDVPWRPREDVRLRVGFRHVETRTQSAGGAAVATVLRPMAGYGGGSGGGGGGGGGGIVGRQEEVYASAAFARRLFGAEVAGLVIAPANAAVVAGGGASARLGFTWGGALEASALHRSDGWHTQLTPTVFYWPLASLGLGAGARVTLDPVGTDVSGRIGVTWRPGPLTLHAQGHYGGERWPFDIAAFTVTSLAATLEYGGTLTALLRVSPSIDLGLQVQVERLAGGTERGTYVTAGLGLRWSYGRNDPGVATAAP